MKIEYSKDRKEVLVEINEDNNLPDYMEKEYFQQENKCGMYRSYGFGTNLEILKDGEMQDLMNQDEKKIFLSLDFKPVNIIFRYYGDTVIQ